MLKKTKKKLQSKKINWEMQWMGNIHRTVAEIKRISRQMLSIKKEIKYACSHRQHPDLIKSSNEIKTAEENLITSIPEH